MFKKVDKTFNSEKPNDKNRFGTPLTSLDLILLFQMSFS